MLERNDLQAIAELIRSEVQPILEDVAELKQDISDLKQEVSYIKERVTKIEVVQENVTNKNIQVLFEGQQGMNEKFRKLDRMEMTLNDVKSDTEVIKGVVASHSKSIQDLKLAK